MKHRAVLVAAAILAMFALGMPPANAATLVVDDDGQATATNCNDTSAAASSTIQGAITAASAGDTIKVCPGTYNENVTVDKANLTVDGAKAGKDARTRSQTGESIVVGDNPTAAVHLLENGIEWDGFTVSGNASGPGLYTSPSFSGYDVVNNVFKDNVFGLYLHSSAVYQNLVLRNRFTANNRPGSASGNGIYSDQGVQRALITSNKFEGNENTALVFAGTTQNQLTIERNQSTDDRTLVALFNTSNTTVAANTFRDERNDRPTPGSAIFVGGGTSGVLVQGNTISAASASGIAVRDNFGPAPINIDVVGNKVRNADNNGIDVTAGVAQVEVRSNSVQKSANSGLFLGEDTGGNLIVNNSSLKNGGLDCKDDSEADTATFVGTAGTANTWMDNKGKTDSPDGLCRP